MKKKVGTILPEELLVKARLSAVKEGKRLNQLLEEALREYLAKREERSSTRSIVEETKGALKADEELVAEILQEEPFYGEGKVNNMAKVKSDRDILDTGMKALVEALGYSGAIRFLRHFTKGEGDYLVIQEEIFKGMDLEQIYQKAKEHHESGKR